MAYVLMVCIAKAHIVMTPYLYTRLYAHTYIVMAYVVMAWIAKAYIVMAYA